ncbi:MAG TPA: flagellar export chaperone FliS [Spirochaetota bacterium]|jgi:flagellar protein FliS|nr:flagellar export chaperone FliS [Spirochaetota bacterium]HQG43518.1 flagellar export chaperone FliS [Spirochaetota bacterium]
MALPARNPYDQYKHTEINTANQGKLIVMLYDGAIKFCNIAIENMQPKTYDIANINIIKAQDIINELILALNMNDGGDIARNLFNLYIYFKKQLLEANIQKNSDILKNVVKLLKELRDAWDKISAQETPSDRAATASKGSFSIEG